MAHGLEPVFWGKTDKFLSPDHAVSFTASAASGQCVLGRVGLAVSLYPWVIIPA